MKNVLKIVANIFGFLVMLGLLVVGCLELNIWNCGESLTCLCIFAGLLFLHLIVSNHKGTAVSTAVGSWISGLLLAVSYGALIPVWIFNLDSQWLGYLAFGLIGLSTIILFITSLPTKKN